MNSEQEILVGLSISLTGKLSRQGQQAFNGLRLWESYVNAEGGVALGARGRRRVRLVYHDDQSRASQAQQNAVRLITQDRVDLLLGPYSSGLTLGVAQVAEQHSKLLWNHGGSSDEIFNRGYRYLVSAPSPASDYLRSLPQWLAKASPGLRRILIVHSAKGTFPAHVARGALEAARAVGVHSVEVLAVGSQRGWADAVMREMRARGPQVVILAADFQDELQIMRARSAGADWPDTVQEVAAVAAGVRAFYHELGRGAEGVIGPSQWEPAPEAFAGPARRGGPAPEAPPERAAHTGGLRGPDSSWFLRSFQERFGELPEYTAAGSFAIGLVLEECIRRAGSLEDERLLEVAAELDLNTFYGRFRIDPETGRQIAHRVLLIRWQEGRKVVVAEQAPELKG
jgi:branched-chain amino acid transport system substrate-binding protein